MDRAPPRRRQRPPRPPGRPARRRLTPVVCALALLAVVACKDDAKPATTCKAQVAELRQFLLDVYGPTKMTAPGPTGDPAWDAKLEAWREELRALAAPADPAKPQQRLSEGTRPGLLDEELARCPAASAFMTKIGATAPSQRVEAMISLADEVGRCDCAADVRRLKALLYLLERGVD